MYAFNIYIVSILGDLSCTCICHVFDSLTDYPHGLPILFYFYFYFFTFINCMLFVVCMPEIEINK